MNTINENELPFLKIKHKYISFLEIQNKEITKPNRIKHYLKVSFHCLQGINAYEI